MQFQHGHRFLLLSHDLLERSRHSCGNHTFPHTPFLPELCLGHGIKIGFGLFDSGEDGRSNGVRFVKIFKTSAKKVFFSLKENHFT